MGETKLPAHILVLFDGSDRARRGLDVARRLADQAAAAITVVTVAVIEEERRGCCDLRSGVWNRLQREDAEEHLRLARLASPDLRASDFCTAAGSDIPGIVDRVARERGCDLVIVPSAPRSFLRRRPALDIYDCPRMTAREASSLLTLTEHRSASG